MSEERQNSYYASTINKESDFPILKGTEHADVAIIGGGFTGVTTAVELAERGYRVAVVEAKKIGWGASGRNGGQVTGSLSGYGAMAKKMRKTLGNDATDFVWNLRWRGHKIIKQRVEKYKIACDLKHGHLQTAYKRSHLKELRQDFENIQRHEVGQYVRWLDSEEVRHVLGTNIYHGAIRNDYNMHVHSLNLCLGEAYAANDLGTLIFENSPVLRIVHGDQPAVVTEQGRIQADKVIIAGNAYHQLEHNQLKGRLFPAVLGIVTTEPLSTQLINEINPEDLAVYDTRVVLDYYRLTSDKRLLFGGGANYSGKGSDDIRAELRPSIEYTFPQLKGIKIDYHWQGLAGIIPNRIPDLGQLSSNIFYAQGYSGHGIATSHIIGEILACAVTGNLEEFNAFEKIKHIRVPLGDVMGNTFLALGMSYYQLLEKIR